MPTKHDESFTFPGSVLTPLQRVGYVAWCLALEAIAALWAEKDRDDFPEEPEAILALEAGCREAIKSGDAGRAIRLSAAWKRAWTELLGETQ